MAVETRTHVRLDWMPEGPDDGSLPRTFTLRAWTKTQRRDGRTRGRWLDTGPETCSTVAEDISRAEMAAHIADTAGWLASDPHDWTPQ